MRVVFMGTPGAAVPSLRALTGSHEIAEVYTQPDRPAGRGLESQPSPVKSVAAELGLAVHEPATLRADDEHERLRAFAPDVVVVVAFGMILPPEVLAAPRLASVNVHFSLLPRWRGAAPVERAIMSGDRVTGITTMVMDEGLDTGPILLQERDPIGLEDTGGSLTDRLAERGAELLLRSLAGLEDGSLKPRPQPDVGATYARKLSPSEAELEYELPAERLVNRVRALDPSPGAFTWFRNRRLKVARAVAVPGTGLAGTIAAIDAEGPDVQTTQGRLRLLEVQPEGKRRMSGAEFVNGYRPAIREVLGAGHGAGPRG